jgi:hypothetical protein
MRLRSVRARCCKYLPREPFRACQLRSWLVIQKPESWLALAIRGEGRGVHSPLTPHPSPLTPHPSPLTPHPSPLTPHPSTFDLEPSTLNLKPHAAATAAGTAAAAATLDLEPSILNPKP